jgi:urea transport system ATP-binding protein
LLVDEPAAGLTDAETALKTESLLELKGHHTIIVIEHDMEFVRSCYRGWGAFNLPAC